MNNFKIFIFLVLFVFSSNLMHAQHNAFPFKEIPSIWPIKGGIGYISKHFGRNLDTLNRQYYIHKGINISTNGSRDPVIATADGNVVAEGFDEEYGNYVIIRHEYGFHTKYANLLSITVKQGQDVKQEDIIGFIGNTGFSDESHLYYEVIILSDVANPIMFINIKDTITNTEIPNIWPIKGDIGHISKHFGQNQDTLTGQYYFHSGIDISINKSVAPIIATADGQVVRESYDEEYGNTVIIKHRYGFFTRYANLLSVTIMREQNVKQGDTIGYIGNTKGSNTPHLHYEVQINYDVVNPYRYINAQNIKENID